MRSTAPDDGGVYERVMTLTQRVIAEANKFDLAFHSLHRMHSTDANALIRVRIGQERGNRITAGWLAEELGLTSGAVTAVVDRLERSGNLRRVRDQHDRRRVLLEISPDGGQLVEKYFAPIRQGSEQVMEQFTTTELEAVSRYLAATAAAMEAHTVSLTSMGRGGD